MVKNIDAKYAIYSGMCFLTMRYNIIDLGSPTANEFLEISFPPELISMVRTVSGVARYQDRQINSHSLMVRVEEKKAKITNGVGGDFSSNVINTGYQGFSIVFPCKLI